MFWAIEHIIVDLFPGIQFQIGHKLDLLDFKFNFMDAPNVYPLIQTTTIHIIPYLFKKSNLYYFNLQYLYDFPKSLRTYSPYSSHKLKWCSYAWPQIKNHRIVLNRMG